MSWTNKLIIITRYSIYVYMNSTKSNVREYSYYVDMKYGDKW